MIDEKKIVQYNAEKVEYNGRIVKYLMLFDPRIIMLKVWLRLKYKPAIRHYNKSNRMGAIYHLLVDFNDIYLSLSYDNKVKCRFGVSKQTFNKVSRDVYDGLVKRYYSNPEDLDMLLYIR